MITHLDRLTRFREEIYHSFKKRCDSLMNLLDALSSRGNQSRSVIELSEAPCFKRQYSSVTDALSDGLPATDWEQATQAIFTACQDSSNQSCWHPVFVLDCTGNPRPFSRKLADRTINHCPNPAPGNRPIAVGHQYSCLALLPPDSLAVPRPWLIPLSMERVKSDKKGNEVGMEQLIEHLDQLTLTDRITISVGDSLYGTEACRMMAAKKPKLIPIVRLNSKRHVFSPLPIEATSSLKRGRKKIYGDKMSLNEPATHPQSDEAIQFISQNRCGKTHQVTINCWKNRLLRGSKHYDAREHPLSLLKITVTDTASGQAFKRPLWLSVMGQEREELTLRSIYEYYISRYDIEHFFRFGKTKLLFDKYQTPDVTHEENWWRFSSLAYNQLYLSRELVPRLPKPWEKYLPAYQNASDPSIQVTATPAQAQRGFERLLESLPALAVPCHPRGKPVGRIAGKFGLQRSDQAVIFKKTNEAKPKNHLEGIIQGSEKEADNSNPKKINQFIKFVRTRLATFNLSKEKFGEMLLDTG